MGFLQFLSNDEILDGLHGRCMPSMHLPSPSYEGTGLLLPMLRCAALETILFEGMWSNRSGFPPHHLVSADQQAQRCGHADNAGRYGVDDILIIRFL